MSLVKTKYIFGSPYRLPIYQIKQIISSTSEQINCSTFFFSVVFHFSLSIVDQTVF